MPMYLSVHRHRSRRFEAVAEFEIIAAELSRWTATQEIAVDIEVSGLAADTHRFIMVANYPDDEAALAMALHLDIHLDVETELTRLLELSDLHPLAVRSGDPFGGIE
jgi:hypothetical protein